MDSDVYSADAPGSIPTLLIINTLASYGEAAPILMQSLLIYHKFSILDGILTQLLAEGGIIFFLTIIEDGVADLFTGILVWNLCSGRFVVGYVKQIGEAVSREVSRLMAAGIG